jgi:hypothetical protein
MITTIYGDMDESQLEKRTGCESYRDAEVSWTEYWLKGEMVHRSVHAVLKGRQYDFEAAQLH